MNPLKTAAYVSTPENKLHPTDPQRMAAVHIFFSGLTVRSYRGSPDNDSALTLRFQGNAPSSVDNIVFPLGIIEIDRHGIARLGFSGYEDGCWLIRDFDYEGYLLLYAQLQEESP